MGVKEEVSENLDRAQSAAIELSRKIHADPEHGFEEFRASASIGSALAEAGYEALKKVLRVRFL